MKSTIYTVTVMKSDGNATENVLQASVKDGTPKAEFAYKLGRKKKEAFVKALRKIAGEIENTM